MPKFRVEVVYAYEIEAESKDKAEQHGLAWADYALEEIRDDKHFSVRATEVTDD